MATENNMKKLRNTNVVIRAKQFNPTIFSQRWLIDNRIFKEDDFKKFIFMPVVSQVSSKDFQLLVTPDILQFVLLQTKTLEEEHGIVREILAKIIDLLPHTPFTSMGFNFNWLLTLDDDEKTVSYLKNVFFGENEFFKLFAADKTLVGSLLKVDWNEAKLTLKIQPEDVHVTDAERKGVAHIGIALDFNYHFGVPEDNVSGTLIGYLNRWSEGRQYSEYIVDSFMRGLS